ncbi:MAG: response regulator transcription factor [Acidimicrobiia bacterium]
MRVLVVEDEVRMASTLRRGLRLEGFTVDVASDGLEGLARAREGSYDAIVLDIMLPGLNGFRVCAALREEGVWTPILMLTAKDGDYDHAEALDTGADDFLAKPFSFVVLVAHLRALTRRGLRERPAVLTAGDLRLDPAARRCFRGDDEIELANREFVLLEYLMRRKNEVCSKAAILEHVWDLSFAGDPNIVEVYVRYLRKKIDVPYGRSAIHTVRLAGYRLDPDGG